ncbi:hypothetical protein ACFLRZ_05550 [Bacteroidota bacterium]
MENYSFIQHPFIRILEGSHKFLPGLGKLLAIYYDPETENVSARYKLKNNSNILDLDISSSLFRIQEFRDKHTNIPVWMSQDNLPFGIQQYTKEHADLFNELEHVILVLNYANDFDGRNDLLFFYFNRNTSNFGVSNSNQPLNTENKAIIGFLLNNMIKGIIANHKSDQKVLNLINSHTKSLMRNAAILKDDLLQTKSYYGQSLINLCDAYLKEINANGSLVFQFSEDALEKIKTYQGEINHLRNIINQTVTFASVLDTDTPDRKRIIHEWHLNFEAYVAEKETKQIRQFSEEKEIKTLRLLNKLENAAQKVIAKRNKLTSSNVGKECPQPISAPAITDAMAKHRIKIQELLKKYPDKWPLLRSDFRPLKNIMFSKNDLLSDTA